MIIPEYWAEAKRRYRGRGKQITVRRFGWSNDSQEAAEAHAEARAEEALQRAMQDAQTPRREPKVPYNGAEGLPIREEVIDRHERYVITRNSYGALCLNTPDVLFADIDIEGRTYLGYAWIIGLLISVMIGLATGWWVLAIALSLGLIAIYWNLRLEWVRRSQASGQLANQALERIRTQLRQFPGWSQRIYRTPAGYRILVTHQTFDPDDPEVARFFATLEVDPVYVLMCRNQHCFRARLTAKPWRIEMNERMRPRPGVWPVNPASMATRLAWIEQYNSIAKNYAACSLVTTQGTSIDPLVQPVLEIHDRLTQANSDLPIA